MSRFEWYGRYHAARKLRHDLTCLSRLKVHVRLNREGRVTFYQVGVQCSPNVGVFLVP